MAKTLEELKDELYDSFNKAKEIGDQFKGRNIFSYDEAATAAATAYEAAAKTAAAIINVERELREREETKNGMKLPGKP
ncbi:MAG: hypothetical protein GC185_12875 [Alphaproteobacteria bacterium]|nr:hypothetical protein [Alphaproteobacteria bacterium]